MAYFRQRMVKKSSSGGDYKLTPTRIFSDFSNITAMDPMKYDDTPADTVELSSFNFSIDGYPILDSLMTGAPFIFPIIDKDIIDYGIIQEYMIHKDLTDAGAYFPMSGFTYKTDTEDNVIERPTLLGALIGSTLVFTEECDPYQLSNNYDSSMAKSIYTKTGADISIIDFMQQIISNNFYGNITSFNEELQLCKVTGEKYSVYLEQFLSHDENFIYQRNGQYPFASSGWGASADYITLSNGDNIDVAFFQDWNFYKKSNSGFLVPAARWIDGSSLEDDVFGIKIALNHVNEDGETSSFEVVNDLSDYQIIFYNNYVNTTEVDVDSWEYEIQGDMIVIKVSGNCHPPVFIAVVPPNAGTSECCQAPAIFGYGYFNV